MALPLYAATLFVSAFILFLVQPMIGKMILPKLGGTPQVWNTCMVFFQTMLLAGYGYTHFVSTRLRLKQQLMVHGTLILLPFLVLLPWQSWGVPLPEGPFNLTGWAPELGVNPVPSALYILLVIVGLPFFVVSTTAPLLQKWFSATGHPAAKDPYFLYGASNLGSMLALLAYPAFIEPNMVLRNQALLWTGGFALLAVTVYACIGFVWKPAVVEPGDQSVDAPVAPSGAADAAGEKPPVETAITAKAPAPTAIKAGAPRLTPSVSLTQSDDLTVLRRLKWIALAAVPSSMMLGVTTHITTDLSPVPLIWLIPLTLYLMSFILVFARWPVTWVEEPHKIMVFLQPIFIALMLLSDFMNLGHTNLKMAIFFDFAGFFFTTMVCHGELAKDRPSTRHLTDFYLMMSVGGMLGGMFNGLLAPNIPYLFEFPSAIIAACLLRPMLTEGGWIANFVASMIDTSGGESAASVKKGKGQKQHHVPARSAAVTPNMAITLDIVLAVGVGILSFILFQISYNPREEASAAVMVGYGIPLFLTCAMLFRPLRYGLAVALIIIVHGINDARADTSDLRVRGYFGLIKVRTGGTKLGTYKNMIHGHIDHGMNFIKPASEKDWGDPNKDFSRLATTYYHKLGPAGIVMERFSWFDSQTSENEFKSDARIGASIVAACASPGMALPLDPFSSLWSEPAFATIGLGTGTMASYARPYQHCHYYEIDNLVKRLSLDKRWKANITYQDLEGQSAPYFSYLRDALARGAHVQVLMGDARLRMDMPYVSKNGGRGYYEDPDFSGGPENFYHMMVVDAFSSDAIPAHLITKNAIEMYFKHLTEEGILCVHTSNRFVDLVKVVADVSTALNFAYRRGHDGADERDKGHYTSEWVMVARKDAYLRHLREPPNFREQVRRRGGRPEPYWSTPAPEGRYIWTDDFYNILGVMR